MDLLDHIVNNGPLMVVFFALSCLLGGVGLVTIYDRIFGSDD